MGTGVSLKRITTRNIFLGIEPKLTIKMNFYTIASYTNYIIEEINFHN